MARGASGVSSSSSRENAARARLRESAGGVDGGYGGVGLAEAGEEVGFQPQERGPVDLQRRLELADSEFPVLGDVVVGVGG